MKKGFTLIELMVVVTIIAILSSITMSRITFLVKKAKESATKGNLSTLRASVRIYYVDTVGVFPPSLSSLVSVRYLNEVPNVKLGKYHAETNAEYTGTVVDESGGKGGYWFYDPQDGTVAVNCTHGDLNGVPISSW